ncbi:MAG: hypothetical protein ACSLE0_21725 [Chitinophagaceae bacterium]
MKSVVTTFFEQMEKDVLERLYSGIVDETVAKDLIFPCKKLKNKSFGITDLWNIRRNLKSANSRWNK